VNRDGSPFDRAYGRAVSAERLDDGFATVAPDDTIADVGRRRPTPVPVLDTAGVVLPGLVDLHGHPDFNIFAPWEPPGTFASRYEWRAGDIYHQLIRDPQDRLLTTLPTGTQERYAEIWALVTGVTAIQGANGAKLIEVDSLVRHVDLAIFGAHQVRTMIDLPVDGGASLVWSPQSELRLYGEATRAADALDAGLALGLGADRLPSGSLSLPQTGPIFA